MLLSAGEVDGSQSVYIHLYCTKSVVKNSYQGLMGTCMSLVDIVMIIRMGLDEV